MTTQTINLEMIPKGIPPIIHVSQYDKGQTWEFNLLLNSQAFTIPAGSTVTIQGTKPDQTGFQYACTYSGSVVTAEEEDQMTILPGDTKAEIVIANSGDVIASINIIIRVEAAALSDDTQISETDLPLIQAAAQAAEVVPGLVEDAEAWANGTKNGVPVGPTDPAYENNAEYYAQKAAEATANAPYIGANGNWYVWDSQTEAYVDSGEPSQGEEGPEGPTGPSGNGIVSISKTGTAGLVDTYTILFTNGNTTTFTVTNGQDGTGSGDMSKSTYDSDNAVATAGGIAAYVHDDLITDAQWTAIQAILI